jgi:hypothetical protein
MPEAQLAATGTWGAGALPGARGPSRAAMDFTLTLVVPAQQDRGQADAAVLSAFPGAMRSEAHLGYLRFKLPRATCEPLSLGLHRAEAVAVQVAALDFELHPASLQDIFLHVVRSHALEGEGHAPVAPVEETVNAAGGL